MGYHTEPYEHPLFKPGEQVLVHETIREIHEQSPLG